mgnify:CR=1 FL=1
MMLHVRRQIDKVHCDSKSIGITQLLIELATNRGSQGPIFER